MIPDNIIANADDFGFDEVISDAIILSYQQGLINSTSMIVNSGYFDDAVVLIKQNPIVKNIGVHINLTLGRPLTNINSRFLDKYGCWNPLVTNRFLNLYPSRTSEVFFAEICTQIERLLKQGIEVNHLDSHHHVHILPCYIALFMRAAKKYNLKLRLAQTRGSGNLFKHLYRQEINRHIFNENLHYSSHFIHPRLIDKHDDDIEATGMVELMFHPYFDESLRLTDSYDKAGFRRWVNYLHQPGKRAYHADVAAEFQRVLDHI